LTISTYKADKLSEMSKAELSSSELAKLGYGTIVPKSAQPVV
jgi:hypothetical protein